MLVEVVPYQSSWPMQFEEEKVKIATILGDNLVACYHIGSTSVEGLSAKPIIDIMPVVHDISIVDLEIASFHQIGYESLGEYGITGRRFFRKGGEKRTHHIHIFEATNSKDINRHLAVRDYLREHPKVSQEYAKLKMALAQKFITDIDGYCDGKDAFMKQMEQDALEWWLEKEKNSSLLG